MGRAMARGSLSALILAAMLSTLGLPAAAQAPAPANPPAPAPAPLTGPVYLISFFETTPAAAQRAAGAVRDYVSATRKSDGNTGALALAETARPGRFALVEVWRDKATAEAHGKALAALRDSVQGLLVAPFDTRFNGGLDAAGPAVGGETAAGGTTIYVLTHVDVFPAGKDQTIEMLKRLADDSRKEPGNLRFDVLQQEGRANHLPVLEAWRNAGARDTHVKAEHTRSFRAELVKLQGALYDERLYRAVR